MDCIRKTRDVRQAAWTCQDCGGPVSNARTARCMSCRIAYEKALAAAHTCSICGSEYHVPQDALDCEAGGLPPASFRTVDGDEELFVGKQLTYPTEDTMFGSRYCYSSDHGVVLGGVVEMVRLRNAGRRHGWLLVVQGQMGQRERRKRKHEWDSQGHATITGLCMRNQWDT